MTEYDDVAEVLADAVTTNDAEVARRMLIDHADQLIRTGDAELVVAAAECVGQFDAALAGSVGLAKLMLGDWYGAATVLRAAVPESGPVPARLAWRVGLAAYLQGDILGAERELSRGTPEDDEPLLVLWSGVVQADLGALDRGLRLARRALELAGQGSTIAAECHAVISELAGRAGDWRTAEAHHQLALDTAARFADVPSGIRLAITDCAQRALQLVEETGYRSYRPRVLHELGAGLARTGRYRAALTQLAEARKAYEGQNSWGVSRPLTAIGSVCRRLGQVAQARAASEEAVRYASAGGDQRILAMAQAELARVRAADDLMVAAELADAAIAIGTGVAEVEARLARGWIALLANEPEEAADHASTATRLARQYRDQAGLAEALELSAACARPDSAPAALADATSIWTDLGDPLGIARTELAAARLRGDRAAVLGHTAAIRQLGVRMEWSGMADALGVIRLEPAVRIEALGRFQVIRVGAVVGAGDWQSKKARDLLKILLSRRGNPVTRDELHHLLWPDETELASNRLSVILTILRNILDGGRADRATNPAVVADRTVVRLDLSVVDTDVERYIDAANDALDNWRRDRPEALEKLHAVARAYTGEFCAEDPYDAWAQPMREELTSLQSSVLRALAKATQTDLAVWALLGVLRLDPYDEAAYLDLIGLLQEAGRYGEARRQYRRYADHMAELAVQPEPFPGTAPEYLVTSVGRT